MRISALAITALLAGCATALPPQPPAPRVEAVGAIAPQPQFAGPAEVETAAALQRIGALNPLLHAVIATDPSAMDQARRVDSSGLQGPLAGKPVLIKDNIEAAGPMPTTAGSLALAANVTGRDAPLVARLRDAGAILLGKTNLSEWANFRSTQSISGWSAVGGQARNPYALDRNPCGSSSGSAAAVAAGMVRLAIGTETDGSITCPASINGIVGLKPTVGLVSRSRIVPISVSQDTAGTMTASVREAAELLSVIAGSDPADPATKAADSHKTDYAAALDPNALSGKRIGVMRFASGFGTDDVFNAALDLLKSHGAILVEIKKIDNFDEDVVGSNEFKVLLTEFKAGINAYLATTPPAVQSRTLADLIAFDKAHAAQEMPLFGQEIFEQAEKTKGLDDRAYRKARRASFDAAAGAIDGLLKKYHVVALIGPTVSPAWKIDAVNGDQVPGGGAGNLAAVAGYPHLTVPMGLVKGLPVGLSFIGPKWSEELLLDLGYSYEQARGPFPAPTLIPSIETSPAVAPALEPQELPSGGQP
jgi:amidase